MGWKCSGLNVFPVQQSLGDIPVGPHWQQGLGQGLLPALVVRWLHTHSTGLWLGFGQVTAKSSSWQLLPSLHGQQCETRPLADSLDHPSIHPSIHISVCICFKPGLSCNVVSAGICVPILAHTELVSSSTMSLLGRFSWAGESRGACGRVEKAESARRPQCWHHWTSPLGFCSPLPLEIHALALGDSRDERKALLPLLPWSFCSH